MKRVFFMMKIIVKLMLIANEIHILDIKIIYK